MFLDICQMEDGRILDEPLELQDLRCYARNMPNVGDLLSRLSSRTVEDPFVKSNGEKFTERLKTLVISNYVWFYIV